MRPRLHCKFTGLSIIAEIEGPSAERDVPCPAFARPALTAFAPSSRNTMTQEHSLEVAAFANSLHALLSTSPPLLTSLGANGASSSLPLLAQLLQPSFLNGQEEEHSVWHALQQLPAPTSSSTSPTAPSTNTASAPPSPYLALASVGAPHDLGHLEIVDDGSCCISCPLNVSSAEEIQLTPHFITLAELPRAEGTAGERKDDKEKWWAPHWSKGKTEGETKRTLAKKVSARRPRCQRRAHHPFLRRRSNRLRTSCRFW